MEAGSLDIVMAMDLARLQKDVAQAERLMGTTAAEIDRTVKAVKQATDASTQAAGQTIKSWTEFLRGRMGPAMKEFGGDHSKAIKKLAAEWAEYKRTGQAALTAVAQSGATASAATQRISASESRFIESLKRQAVVASEGKAAWLALRAQQLGMTAEAAPYIAKLQAVEKGQKNLGHSAHMAAMAMHQLPMQITDIATSLASGQRPMLVFLQQGGQLKDLFGGIGPAARAVGGYIMGMVNPITVTAAAVAALGYAWLQGSEESREFQNAATMSGNAIGLAAHQYSLLRDNLAGIAGTRGKAAEVLTEIAATGRVTSESVREIAEAAILMEKATGKAVAETVKEFIKLSDEPAKASADLNRQYNFLTASVYEQIKALEEQGRKTEAARLAEETYAKAIKDRATSVVDSAGLMERAWGGVAGAAKRAWDAMLNVGRPQTVAEQFAEVSAEVAKARGPFDPWVGGNAEARARLGQNMSSMQSLFRQMEIAERNQMAANETAAVQSAAVGAIDAVTKANERGWNKQQQMNKALEDYQANIEKIRAANPASALLDPKQIAAAEKAIRAQFADKAAAKDLERSKKLLAELSGLSEDFAEDWKRLGDIFVASKGQLSVQWLVDEQAKLLAKQPAIKKAAEERISLLKAEAELQAETAKELADAYVAEDQARAAARASVAAYAKGIADTSDELKLELSLVGATEAARKRALALYKIELDLKKQIAAIEDFKSGFDEAQREEERAKAHAAAAQARANVELQAEIDVAEKAQKEWETTNKQIGDSFVDNLMRGGKSVAQYLKDLFRTLVLRPLLAPIGSAMAAGVGMLPTAANAAGSGMLGSIGSSMLGSSIMGGLSGVSLGMGATMTNGIIGGFGANMANIGAMMSGGSYGMALGAAMPYLGLALAAISLLSGAFKGETRSGGKYTGLNFIEGPSGGEINGDASRTAIGATIQNINQTLGALGASARLTDLQSGFESSERGKGFAYAGGTLSTGAVFGQTHGAGWQNRRGSMTPEQAAAAFGEELKQATLQALQAADVPGQLGDYLRQLGDIDQLSGGALDAALARINKALSEKQTLEEQLLTLQSTDLENLTRAREHEREALDESNRALYDQVIALQDQKAATEAAAARQREIDGERYGLETQLLQLQGNTAELRRRELELLDPSNRALYDQITALQDQKVAAEQAAQAHTALLESLTGGLDDATRALVDARRAESDALKDNISRLESAAQRYRAFSNDIRTFRDSLLLGDLSPLTPAQRYAESRRIAEETYALALTGDQGAMSRIPQVAQDFLRASQVYNASSDAYLRDFAAVQAYLAVGATKADEAAAWAEAQAAIGNAQLSALGAINTSVLTVAQAVENLRSAGAAVLNAGGTVGDAQLKEYLSALYSQGEYMQGIEALRATNRTMAQGDALLGFGAGTIEQWARANGVPVFHEGTPYVPQTGLAVLEQGERVTSRGGNDALQAEVQQLRADLAKAVRALIDANYDANDRGAGKVAAAIGGRRGWERELATEAKPQ
jgi:phage-related minor tail protein